MLATEGEKHALHRADEGAKSLCALVPEGQEAGPRGRELHHYKGCGRTVSKRAGAEDNGRGRMEEGEPWPLPSWAQVIGTSHSLLSPHTASSTRASRSSRSRAHASWQRRGPNVPSFWRTRECVELKSLRLWFWDAL